MAKKFLKLIGCSRYTYKNKSYEEKVVTEIDDDELSDYLLSQKDDYGLSYFKEVIRTGPRTTLKVKAAPKAPEPEFEEIEEDTDDDSAQARVTV